jgi:hypothetical protein
MQFKCRKSPFIRDALREVVPRNDRNPQPATSLNQSLATLHYIFLLMDFVAGCARTPLRAMVNQSMHRKLRSFLLFAVRKRCIVLASQAGCAFALTNLSANEISAGAVLNISVPPDFAPHRWRLSDAENDRD